MSGSFDPEVFRQRLQQNRRAEAEAYWGSRMRTGAETGRFATRLMKRISPSDLLQRDFAVPIQVEFGQVTDLAEELGMALEDPQSTNRLLTQGYNDVNDILSKSSLIDSGMPLDTAVETATHPTTLRSIASLALHGQEYMRNRIREGLRATTDPQTGLRTLDEVVRSMGGQEIYNRGCPFASKKALIDNPRAHEAPAVFTHFVAYVGEIAARLTVRYATDE